MFGWIVHPKNIGVIQTILTVRFWAYIENHNITSALHVEFGNSKLTPASSTERFKI